MPAPTSTTYSTAAKIAAHTALRDLIDTGSGAGTIKIRTSADALLGTCTLSDPCGTVNGTTGQLTLSIASGDSSADANGTAAYAEICDVAGNVVVSMPAQAGSSGVSGKIVLNTLTIVSGLPISIVSATIG